MSKKSIHLPGRRIRRHRRSHRSRPSPPRRNRHQNRIHQRNHPDPDIPRITMLTDTTFTETSFTDADILVLPGGMPGTKYLAAYKPLTDLLTDFNNKGKKIAAICAAPSVFSGLGFLKDKKATSYPSFMEVIAKDGAQTSEDSVVTDGNITTSRGLGTAIDFALSIIEQLESKEKADEIAESIVYKR